MDERPTPADTDVPGGFPVTPSVAGEDSERSTSAAALDTTPTVDHRGDQDSQTPTQRDPSRRSYFNPVARNVPGEHGEPTSELTLVSRRSSHAGLRPDSVETRTRTH